MYRQIDHKSCGTEPTKEDMELFAKRFFADGLPWKTFPGEQTRKDLVRLFKKVQSGDIKFQLLSKAFEDGDGVTAMTGVVQRPDGTWRSNIVVSLKTATCDQNIYGQELGDMVLIMALVHELYHAEHQVLSEEPLTAEAFRQGESDAWLYTCKTALSEMHDAQILQRFPERSLMRVAFEHCKAGRLSVDDPMWQRLLDYAVGKR